MQGISHPFQTPAHILLVLALGILIAQQQKKIFNLIAFSVSIIIGLIINQLIQLKWDFDLILLFFVLSISLIVIIRFKLYHLLLIFLIIISGIGLGLNSDPIRILGFGVTSIYSWLLGAFTGFELIILLMVLIAIPLHRYWNGIVLRVMSSWLATSAIFVLTFLFVEH